MQYTTYIDNVVEQFLYKKDCDICFKIIFCKYWAPFETGCIGILWIILSPGYVYVYVDLHQTLDFLKLRLKSYKIIQRWYLSLFCEIVFLKGCFIDPSNKYY